MIAWDTPRRWMQLSLLAFMLVAALGLIMRYKIGFSFPYFHQKYLQHAHSHLAFAGWVSQTLWVWITYNIGGNELLGNQKMKLLLFSNFAAAIGMLFTFAYQGYGGLSIFFSSSSLIFSFLLIGICYRFIQKCNKTIATKWYVASFVWFILSTAGTIYLIYMMIQKKIPQHEYLASVYGYLHFQYNGWFFFACIGIWLQHLEKNGLLKSSHKLERSWQLLAWTCLPAYGLSVLWLKLPAYIYLVIIAAAVLQLYGWIHILRQVNIRNYLSEKTFYQKLLMYVLLGTVSMKFILQLLCVIPAMSHFAFGIRPIVIAYLHLVLLGIISLFILFQAQEEKWIVKRKAATVGIIIFIIAFGLNELLLVSQGVASIFYFTVPFIDLGLLIAALLLFLGVTAIYMSQITKSISED
ncbi:MAG: hypothetical protein MH132_09110 [Hydrotalea sp.]|nr:hypothetical protein [Hydrotalea sp.]